MRICRIYVDVGSFTDEPGSAYNRESGDAVEAALRDWMAHELGLHVTIGFAQFTYEHGQWSVDLTVDGRLETLCAVDTSNGIDFVRP